MKHTKLALLFCAFIFKSYAANAEDVTITCPDASALTFKRDEEADPRGPNYPPILGATRISGSIYNGYYTFQWMNVVSNTVSASDLGPSTAISLPTPQNQFICTYKDNFTITGAVYRCIENTPGFGCPAGPTVGPGGLVQKGDAEGNYHFDAPQCTNNSCSITGHRIEKP